MITAVDSSVLIAIVQGEPGAADWVRTLASARSMGRLVCCEVVYAEVAAGFDTQRALDQTLAKLGIEFEPIQEAAAWCASQVFTAYRHNKGPLQHMIPNFLIAAHAQTQADRLAAIDRGYLRQYFATLPLLQPTL